jgi:replicative DNA helicase
VPTASEHAERVLSAIIPDRVELLENALQKLTYEVFTETVHLNLFKLLERYRDVANGVLSRSALEDMLTTGNTDPGKAELYLETYDLFRDTDVDDTDFYWSIEQLKELAADRATKEVIADAMEIVTRGKDIGRGQVLHGNEDARDYALERFSSIERELTLTIAPEGDMRKERLDILADYAQRKHRRETGTQEGIKFGITELDNVTGGLQRGDFALAAAYTSDGKTTLMVQLAWHAAVKQGKNVVFFTTETVQSVVRRKIVSRHSMEPQFGMPEGINTRDFKAGTLTDVQELRLQEVTLDLEQNPGYGKIYIVQVPREASVLTIEHKLMRLQRQFHIDLVIVDYLAQFRAATGIDGYRERLTDILKEAKRMAVTFNHGEGVPLISPWQINRQSYEMAQVSGHYSKQSLAETSEAERSPDLIISLMGEEIDNTDRVRIVKGQILKNRDGETSNSLRITVDYATSTFTSKTGGSLSTAVASSGGGLDSILDTY